MLDLDRGVVADIREFGVQGLHELERMRRAVQEIRIAKRNMLRPGRHLLAHIGHDDIHRNHAEHALIHRHHRAMAAQMFAAAAAFGEADGFAAAIRKLQVRVARERRQRAPIRRKKFNSGKIHNRLGLNLAVASAQPLHQRHQGRFDFTAQHGINA